MSSSMPSALSEHQKKLIVQNAEKAKKMYIDGVDSATMQLVGADSYQKITGHRPHISTVVKFSSTRFQEEPSSPRKRVSAPVRKTVFSASLPKKTVIPKKITSPASPPKKTVIPKKITSPASPSKKTVIPKKITSPASPPKKITSPASPPKKTVIPKKITSPASPYSPSKRKFVGPTDADILRSYRLKTKST